MFKKHKRSFTLIELLIVVGILGVLIVLTLVTLNPLEAQKKVRDDKRIKDMSTLQAIIFQYMQEGNPPFCTGLSGCNSLSAGQKSQVQPCSSNWLGVDLCKYSNTVPVDPSNGSLHAYITGGSADAPVYCDQTGQPACLQLYYQFIMQGQSYELNARQESPSNASKVLNDGGSGASSTQWVESGSNLSLF